MGKRELWKNVTVPVLVSSEQRGGDPIRMRTDRIGPHELECETEEAVDFSRGEEVRIHYGPLNGHSNPMKGPAAFKARLKSIKTHNPVVCAFDVIGSAPEFLSGPQLLGKDPALMEVKRKALALASYNVSILVTGESGTGKSLLAEVIHENSDRADGPIIKVNCPSVPETLLESELFGHEKGAFTGASARKPGMLELADGGTLVLEEISDLPMPVQGKLLQALEEKKFWAVGGEKVSQADVRIIAISNDHIEKQVKNNEFRLDLYYRLNEATIELPPLRNRTQDIPLLCESFRMRYEAEFGKGSDPFDQETLEQFKQYHWPGNVRELMHVVKRWVLTGRMFRFWDNNELRDAPESSSSETSGHAGGHGLENRKKQTECDAIREALRECDTKTSAASELGISYRTLLRKIKKYGVQESPG